MARDLLLLRHAKSDWDTGTGTDFGRPLAPRGLRDAPRMGDWIRENGLVPDRLVSSPALRARQTTELVAKAAGFGQEILWAPGIYAADVGDLLQILASLPGQGLRTLLVGHNPGLEHLLAFLTTPPDRDRLEIHALKTATLAQISLPDSWDDLPRGCGRLIRIQYPRELA
ncbi:MAG: histidine phosphatase family protein [Magnetococcales bacterium]|nr:histidine phosphatase family protein [Magnetococcales bacterium]